MTFRSLDMKHYSIFIPQQNAYSTISHIAQFQNVHFVNIGDPVNLRYQPQLKRLQQLLQSINILKFALKQANLAYKKQNYTDTNYLQKIQIQWKNQALQLGVQDSRLIDQYQNQIIQQHKRYEQTTQRLEKLIQRKKQLQRQIAIHQTIVSFFGQTNLRQQSNSYFQNYLGQSVQKVSGVSYQLGCIEPQFIMRFNLMIHRVSRGYACIRCIDRFSYYGLGQFTDKIVMVIYPSSTEAILQKKIIKIMQMLCNTSISLQKNQNKINIEHYKKQYQQTQVYIQLYGTQLSNFFDHICKINCIQKWYLFILKQKCIYQTLDKLQQKSQLLIGNIYIPKQKVMQLSINLNRISPAPTLQQTKLDNPPSAFNVNSYTAISQQIVNTYGIPRYKQMNPSIFTTITFPFFFGVMFGDIGHGAVLFGLGLYLIFNDHWISKQGGFFATFSKLRYMVTLMGFFSFYCGWIYNDMLGFSYNFFGSCYTQKQLYYQNNKLIFHRNNDCVYPFGIDPIWGYVSYELAFINSLKMKLSVIIGVTHMSFGVILKAMNSTYFKKKLEFIFQFLPQIIFMVLLFGYMDFLIVFKWVKFWPDTQWAPSIISTMMTIGLSMGKTSSIPDGGSPMWGQPGKTSQDTIQLFILLIAFFCIPIMLIPKPAIQIYLSKKKIKRVQGMQPIQQILLSQDQLQKSLISSQKVQRLSNEFASVPQLKLNANLHNAQDSSQIVVHQLIQTIQYCLGAVSNTASYLRLWALSLAHSQLSKVFFQKTLSQSLYNQNIFITTISNVIFFWLLCWITFGVLMCMDTMQCFLHSLRLHWVQFQNKFYKGDGYQYQPVSIKNYIQCNRIVDDS